MPRPLYKDPAAPIEARVRDLLSRMTLEEKAEQLCQDTIGRDPNPDNHGVDRDFNPLVGSIYQYCGDTRTRNAYQRAAVERTRLGIPILWALDVIHGWRTMFPVSLAQAASFLPSLTERAQRVAARECWQDGGIDWLLGPMVEVGHDPRWGRNVEGYGEDPYTAGRFAAAAVRGIQRDGRCAACVKHFVGYSACEGGRDYSYTEISARAMREWYLPPFAAAAKAGALTVMSSFNEYDGVPIPASRALLTDELRGRMGFRGLVVSDSGALHRMGNMGYAHDPVDQTARAIHAGNEMSMGDGLFRNVPAAVAAGKLSMEDVDEAVSRVLRVKFRLGLFENPYAPEKPTKKTCRLPDAIALAHKFARETMVLLKNDPPREGTEEHGKHGKERTSCRPSRTSRPILPLDPKKIRRLALIGPAGDEVHPHLGNWRAAASDVSKGVNGETFLDAARRFFPKAEIRVARGCTFWDYTPPTEKDAALRAEAVAAARDADVVLLCFGEVPWMCGEKKSRRDISLPPAQPPLIEAIAALGRPLVGLCCSGRALAFPGLAAKMDALLWCWQSGCRAPTAAMEILTGRVNPSGKLPISFPRSVGQIPVFYNHHGKITPDCPDYQDIPEENGPWFPFGFGLSYTTFKYGKVKVTRRTTQDARRKTQDDLRPSTFDASVTVCNTGARAGKETVLWYLSDVEASYTQPVRRVIAFEKIALKPGEAKTVRLRIDPMRDLAYDLPDGRRILEPGEFVLSASLRSEARFVL